MTKLGIPTWMHWDGASFSALIGIEHWKPKAKWDEQEQ
jgi:hypothetical protein